MSFSKKHEEIIGKIDGRQVSVNNQLQIIEENAQHFVVSLNGNVQEIFLTNSGKLSDGNALEGVEVSIQPERQRIIEDHFSQYRTTIESLNTKGIVLKAPMPGKVSAILVAVGDKVEKQTQVLVLEAMKMENSIMAGFVGIVSKVFIQTGMSVDKSMPLIEYSADVR
jgi:biotin carboxyl carrier protein